MRAPKHRKRGRLTLEQFKEAQKNGIGIREMPKVLNVGKNHVGFLSAFDQGKVDHLKGDVFQSDYLSGMSLKEIAEKHNVPVDYIGFLREHFNIPRLGPKFINRKKTEKPLTQRQKEIIYGSLLGDAGRMSSSSLKMKQSTKQRDFLMWKFNELQEHISLNSLKQEEYFDKRFNNTYHFIRFYTNANTEIETILSQFYINNVKTVTQAVLNLLSPLSIAVWFMDDGTTDWGQRHDCNASPASRLCTDSFSKQECEMIAQWFLNKHNINPYIKLRKRNLDDSIEKYRVFFGTTETPKLFDLIRPYVIPSMMYKIDYDAYLAKQSV